MKLSTVSLFVVVFVASSISAQAGTKEELMRLQNDVMTLQNQFREFERMLNENNSGIRSLVEQLNDQVAKANLLLDKVATSLQEQAASQNSQDSEVVPEIRALSSKIDEMIPVLSAISNQVSELKVQSKPINQILPTNVSASDATFNQALNDLIGGDSDVAIEGFNAYLKFFPTGDKADAATYYIGEAQYNMNRYPQAMESFTQIIEKSSDLGRVASALYKRGKSALAMDMKDSAIADFNEVIKRFPEAPEASLSKAELQSLGVLRPNQPK
jgi:tol-pal system protein YbgF